MRWFLFGLRTFVAAGVSFGAVVGLTSGSLGHGLVAGLLFGVFMAVTLTALTRVRSGPAPDSLSTRQQVQLSLDASIEATRARATDALTRMPATITSDTANRVVGRTRPSWWSWGEVVTVDLRAGDRSTELTIRSRPRLRTTIVDYGRNDENVRYLASELQ